MIAIERDERCLPALAEDRRALAAAGWKSIAGDALKSTPRLWSPRAEGAPLRICANLPYNIATPC